MKRHVSRVLALALSVCLLWQSVSAAVLGGVLRESRMQMAVGMEYNETTYWHTAANGRQSEHYYTYTPNDTVTPMVYYGGTLYGRSTLDTLSGMLAGTGRTVVAAVNGSFFEMINGVPQGLIVTDGVLRSSGDLHSVGFYADGTAVIGKPGLALRVTLPGGSFAVTYNKALTKTNGIVLYSNDYDDHTKNTVKAHNVILQPEKDELLLTGSVNAVVLYSGEAYSAEIPEGCFTLSMALDTVYTSTLPFLQALEAGDTVTIETSCAENWQSVQYACGGGDLLVENGNALGEFTLNTADKRTSRTAIGVKADGTVVAYTVDGLQTGYSLGVTLSELALRMQELGCVTALNLDGGGSTTVGLRHPGFDALTTANQPSGGGQRACANFIFFTMPAEPAGPASQIFLYPQRVTALPGAQIRFEAGAADAVYRTAAVSGALSYSAAAGTITPDGVYTAALPGVVTVAVQDGPLRDTAAVTVIESPESISVYRGATNVTGTTVAVRYGESIDFSAQAKQAGFSVSADDGCFTWTVSEGLGTIDENGVFTANGTALQGTITASCGEASRSVQIRVTDPDDTPPLISMRFDDGVLTAQVTDDLSGVDELILTCDDEPAEFVWDGQTLTAAVSDGVTIVKLTAADRLGNRAGSFVETGCQPQNVFADMGSHWASKYVGYLHERGVLQGSVDAAGNLNYAPSQPMTRQAFVTALIRWLGVDTSLYDGVVLPFADSGSISAYALPSVRAAYALGYLNGREIGGALYALPRDTVMRQEAMAILGRSQPGGYAEDDLTGFPDADQVSAYARSHIAQMVTRGVISGANGYLNPRGPVTRAQVAKMLFYLT